MRTCRVGDEASGVDGYLTQVKGPNIVSFTRRDGFFHFIFEVPGRKVSCNFSELSVATVRNVVSAR